MRKNRQTAKYHIKSYIIAGSLAGAISMALALPASVMAAQQSLASVTGQAQIQPMGDGSGKYMMKSDGFYCLDVNGAGSNQAEIHYFQDYEIDGTVFDGYYYHDADGKFKACSPHMEHLKGVAVFGDKTDEEAGTQNAQEAEKFDGYYFVNNLGRLSAAPQVRYIDNLAIDGSTLNGYYYFDENGRLVTEPGIHSLEMDCYEMNFDGSYYFGGTNGALLQESTVTDDGFIVDDTGKIVNMDDLGIDNLKPQLEKMLSGYQGTWSVYVKDLNEEKEILINDTSLYSASLIKAFVMAKTYEDMEQVKADEAKKLNTADTKTVDVKLNDLLWNMITVSDNESCNELVKLQTDSLDFKKGAEDINKYLEKEGYTLTEVDFSDLLQNDLALNDGEIDFNVEQHTAYAENFNEAQKGNLVPISPIPTVPAAIFSATETSLDAIQDGAKVAVPDDAANTARAYVLLQKAGWITLNPDVDLSTVTQADITENPYNIEFTEMNSTNIPAVLDDFDYAVITGSIVYNAGIDPSTALLQEDILPHLILQVVVKEENKDAQWAKDIVAAYHSDEFKEYLDKNNNGLWFVPEELFN